MLQNDSSSRSLDPRRQVSWASRTTLHDTWIWFSENLITIWFVKPEQFKSEDHFVHIVLLFQCPLVSRAHYYYYYYYYYLSWVSVRESVKLYESLSLTHVREHIFFGSEASIWQRLTASNAVSYHVYQMTKTCPPADLSTHDNNKHGAHTGSFLIT